jgi:hypothetical protein
MSGARVLPFVIAALAVAAAGIAPARAQCRLCETPTTTPEQSSEDTPIELQIESSLDFDRLILIGEGGGAAVIRPDGSNAQEGSVALGPRAMVGSASVHGEPGRAVRVELPRRIDLYSTDGGRISVDEVFSDLPSLPRLDSGGNLSFRFGGRIRISGDSEGQYRGDLPITVEYL